MSELVLNIRHAAMWPASVVALAVMVVVWWTYRRTYPPLSAGYRLLLAGLRSVVVLLLGLLVLEPLVALSTERNRPERLAVLVDRSASMLLPVSSRPGESADSRLNAAREFSGMLATARDTTVTIFGFGRGLAELEGEAGLDERNLEDRTDLAGALEQLRSGAGPGWDRVVVISDGMVNAGIDPLAVPGVSGMRVDAVLIGSRPVVADLALTGIEQVAPAYEDGEVELELTIARTGEVRGLAAVDVFLDGRKVAERRVTLAGEGAGMNSARVTFDAPEAGDYWLRAEIRGGGEEWSALNNSRLFRLRVRKSRRTFLLVSNSPDWDLTFAARALAANEDWEVEMVLALENGIRRSKAGRGFRPGGMPAAAELAETALVVLHGKIHEFGRSLLDRLAARAGEGAFALVVWPAGDFNPRALPSGLASLLPSAPGAGAIVPVEAPQTPARLLTRDRYGVLDALAGGGAIDGLPPLTTVYRGVQLARSAEVLGRAGSRGPLAGEGPPVLSVRPTDGVRCALVTAQGLWRWHMQRQLSDPEEAALYFRMWRELADWLTSAEKKSPLALAPQREVLSRGMPVRLEGTISEEPVETGTVVRAFLWQTGGTGSLDTLAVRTVSLAGGEREFTVDFGVFPPGRYNFTAEASAGADTLRAGGELAVEPYSPELAEPGPDSTLLAALCAATGGRLVRGVEQAGELWSMNQVTEPVTTVIALARTSWIYWLLVVLLAAEWVLRRRKALS
ncbi:MAG: VWA domain-containing protein [Candidatus Glassbacteria bacterium]|nr:VWA domain-containing protein [Candidatus Glassbacteria bacterium]